MDWQYSDDAYTYDDAYQRTYPYVPSKSDTRYADYVYDSAGFEFTEVVTTLCIRNLPCTVGQERMTQELWQLGFGGAYDFLYLPRRSCGKCLGYGFINFRSNEDARSFAEVFQNYRFNDTQSVKHGYAEPSRVQGFEANLNQFVDALFNAKRGMNTGPILSF
eukprot:TRINITY_DN13747_c0_g1_i1.p1 TRINITY_DN13747_c0_g1~~TRINITY_DN13747_c0_g1_i1.p1  ORF type:complete len:162 (+),score=19.98 TRINITY_DN13747_c0_g1_i1:95-580(+)